MAEVKVSLVTRFVIFGLSAGWLAVGLAWVGLLIGLAQPDGLMRYPGAVRLAGPEFRLESLPKGQVQQYVVYHTAGNWPQALSWYARYLKLDLDRRPRLTGNCIQFTDTEAWMIIRQSMGVTLCSRADGTTIFVNRLLALPW